jgi:type IV pilus assembly protein PilB
MQGDSISTKRLGEILIEKGFLQKEQLEKALEVQKQSNNRLGQTLIFLGLITEEQLADCLAQQLGIPYISMRTQSVDQDALSHIPADIAKRYRILPFDRMGTILTIAISDVLSDGDITEIEKAAGCKVKFFFITVSDFKTVFEEYYPGERLAS